MVEQPDVRRNHGPSQSPNGGEEFASIEYAVLPVHRRLFDLMRLRAGLHALRSPDRRTGNVSRLSRPGPRLIELVRDVARRRRVHFRTARVSLNLVCGLGLSVDRLIERGSTQLAGVPVPFGELAWNHARAVHSDARAANEDQLAAAVAALLSRANAGPSGPRTSASKQEHRVIAGLDPPPPTGGSGRRRHQPTRSR